jgi:hypothetical protein
MFDFIRNLGRSEKQQKQEALSAYLDGELAPDEEARVEQQLASDSDLRDELAEMEVWQTQMRNLPVRRVPRNFTLDPALYGHSQRQSFAVAYPVLRTATVVTAFLFVIALAVNLYLGGFVENLAPQPEAASVMSSAAEVAVTSSGDTMAADMDTTATAEPFQLEESEGIQADELAIELVEEAEMEEVTRVVTETVVEETEPSPEPGVAERGELLSETPQEGPVLELEPVEDSQLQSQASPESTETTLPEEMQDAEIAAAEEALKAQEVPRTEIPAAEESLPETVATEQPEIQEAPLAEEQQFLQPPTEEQQLPQLPADDGSARQTSAPILSSLSTLVLGLGLLFVLLTILTLLVRGRR